MQTFVWATSFKHFVFLYFDYLQLYIFLFLNYFFNFQSLKGKSRFSSVGIYRFLFVLYFVSTSLQALQLLRTKRQSLVLQSCGVSWPLLITACFCAWRSGMLGTTTTSRLSFLVLSICFQVFVKVGHSRTSPSFSKGSLQSIRAVTEVCSVWWVWECFLFAAWILSWIALKAWQKHYQQVCAEGLSFLHFENTGMALPKKPPLEI